MMTSERSRKTRRVSSAQRWKTPWVPGVPMPSTMSLVIRKGTRSGTGRSLPYSKFIRILDRGHKHDLLGRRLYQDQCERLLQFRYLTGCSRSVDLQDPECVQQW